LEVCESESESESESGTHFGGVSGKKWTLEKDIQGFVSILFEIMFGVPLRK
jgi:hypothetical protein